MTDFTDNELDIIRQALPPGTAMDLVLRRLRQTALNATTTRLDWDRWCSHFGLTPADFGKVFIIKTSRFRVTGISPQAHRYPINCERLPDGKVFRVPASSVR